MIVTRGAALSACWVRSAPWTRVRANSSAVRYAGRQGGDRLGTDQHPGVLDDHEHLPDAVVHVPDQGAHRRAVRAEGQLAGGGDLQAHLVLDAGDLHPVPLAEVAVGVHQVLGHEKHGQALGARAMALRPGQHQMEDVLGQVVLAAGDEPLDALDVPGSVRLRHRAGPARTHVRAGVRLGQHHGRGPVAVDRPLREPLLLRRAEPPQDVGEQRAARVHPDARVGAQHQFGDRPAERAGGADATEFGGQVEPEPFGVQECLVGALEPGRQGDRAGGGIEHRRMPVPLGEGVGQRADGEPVHLGQDAAGGIGVEVRERRRCRAHPGGRSSSNRLNSMSRRLLL